VRWSRALGAGELPDEIELPAGTYRLERRMTHGFAAATAAYARDGHRVVLKAGRRAPLLFLPLGWVGRWLTRREAAYLGALQDLPGIPPLTALVGDDALVHEFVEGRPMDKHDDLPAEFFDQLDALIAAMHARGFAFTDLSKYENVLVGDDGRPWLVDLQTAWEHPAPPERRRRWLPDFVARRVLLHLQAHDLHMCLRHRGRILPDSLSAEQRARLARRGFLHRLHHALTAPWRRRRRRRGVARRA
jgi:hypothetical protein